MGSCAQWRTTSCVDVSADVWPLSCGDFARGAAVLPSKRLWYQPDKPTSRPAAVLASDTVLQCALPALNSGAEKKRRWLRRMRLQVEECGSARQ